MATLKHKLTESPKPPERGVRAATFHLLLDTAMQIIREAGHIPSVAEVAARSKVSRATAYRYFPSRSVLITAVIDNSLQPVRGYKSKALDGRERVRELFVQTFPLFKQFEPQMRAALQLALEHWALERAGLSKKRTIGAATACASSSMRSHRSPRRCPRRCAASCTARCR